MMLRERAIDTITNGTVWSYEIRDAEDRTVARVMASKFRVYVKGGIFATKQGLDLFQQALTQAWARHRAAAVGSAPAND